MSNPQPNPEPPARPKHRRRWPWITGAVVLVVFVLAVIFSGAQHPQGTPSAIGVLPTSSSDANQFFAMPTSTGETPVTTTVPTTTTTPTTTQPTTTRPVVATTTTTVVAPRTVTAPRTTVRHVAPKPTAKPKPKPAPKPVAKPKPAPKKPAPAPKPKPKPKPPAAPTAGAKYHAGEFCSTVGAHAISTSKGKHMTCLQEGKYKRWHND